MVALKSNQHLSLIKAQETEVRILHEYTRDYYKYTKNKMYSLEGSTELLSPSPLYLYDVPLNATGCSDSWGEPIK